MKIRVSTRAARQLRSASGWWQRNREKAPDALADELDSVFALIREFPNAGEPVLHSTVSGVRRILLGRVQYHLYFRADREVIEVLALWHSSRGAAPHL